MFQMPRDESNSFSRSFLRYGGALVVVVLAYLGIRTFGNTLSAPSVSGRPPIFDKFTQVHVNDFVHVLLAVALVIASARVLGAIFKWIHQPPVVGEMIAGIMLGPSFLGHLAPRFGAYILPQSIAPLLNVVSQFGVILYMFLVGLELDLSSLKGQAKATVTISHSSIVTPFLLGSSLALLLYPQLSDNTVSFTAFSLFLGVAMSVTAFPVLARILTDRGIHKTRMGSLTLACAAIDDVTAWCLLAFVMSVVQASSGGAVRTVSLALGYIAVMWFVARPLVARMTHWLDRKGRVTQGGLAIILLLILASSLATETIGIHSIFGAFVLGAIIPNRSSVAKELTNKLEDFVIVFLLPAFFAFTGLRTQIALVNDPRDWMFCLLIIVVASIGKFGGSTIAGKFSGLSWRDASAVGVLMNTRGLMELIVLNIGLELHIISPRLFAMLVIMALATTVASTPILHFIMPRGDFDEEVRAAEESHEAVLATGKERTPGAFSASG
jgi:Kef-type K+ transport system membrane component KefB